VALLNPHLADLLFADRRSRDRFAAGTAAQAGDAVEEVPTRNGGDHWGTFEGWHGRRPTYALKRKDDKVRRGGVRLVSSAGFYTNSIRA